LEARLERNLVGVKGCQRPKEERSESRRSRDAAGGNTAESGAVLGEERISRNALERLLLDGKYEGLPECRHDWARVAEEGSGKGSGTVRGGKIYRIIHASERRGADNG